jgi:plasmid stabilization system protein ParE
MRTEFDIFWSKESKVKLDSIVFFLRKKWTEKEVNKFLTQIKEFERIVVKFPEIYAESKKKTGLRRAVLSKHNSVIYEIDWEKALIKAYTIFDNRQHPESNEVTK